MECEDEKCETTILLKGMNAKRKRKQRVRDELEGNNGMDNMDNGAIVRPLTNTLHLAHPPAGARALSLTSIRGKMNQSHFSLADLTNGKSKHTNEYVSPLLPQIATNVRRRRKLKSSIFPFNTWHRAFRHFWSRAGL